MTKPTTKIPDRLAWSPADLKIKPAPTPAPAKKQTSSGRSPRRTP